MRSSQKEHPGITATVKTEVQDPSSSQTVSLAEPGGNTSVYIEYLKLNPVKIKLNFLKGGEDDQEEISLHLVKRMVGKSTNSSHQRAQTLRFIVDIAMAVTSNISTHPLSSMECCLSIYINRQIASVILSFRIISRASCGSSQSFAISTFWETLSPSQKR